MTYINIKAIYVQITQSSDGYIGRNGVPSLHGLNSGRVTASILDLSRDLTKGVYESARMSADRNMLRT